MTRTSWSKWGRVAASAMLTIAGGWLAFEGSAWHQQRSERQAIEVALPALSSEIHALLNEVQSRLLIANVPDLLGREQLSPLLRELHGEFAFVVELGLHDIEGRLLRSTRPSSTGRMLDPGRATLHETALNTETVGYSSPYGGNSQESAGRLVDLFVPAKRGERQSIIATLSVPNLLRQAREKTGHGLLAGIELAVWPTDAPASTARDSQHTLSFEHQGLRLTLGATVTPGAQTRAMAVLRWLMALLGAACVSLIILWTQAARLRKLARERYAQLEKQVNADARTAILGEMSTAIAHELNHPLGAISNYAYGLEKMARQQGLAPSFIDGISQIRNEAQRGAEVIKSIRSFLHRDASEPETIDVRELLREMRPLLDMQAHSLGCRLSVEAGRGLQVQCPKTLLQQAILNLTRNGLEAMQDVPRVNRLLQVRASKERDSGRVTLAVVDSGPGLSESAQRSLFKPFFTTKKDGLGIGLSLCQSIAERHDGVLRWKNNVEGGACFELEIPSQAGARGTA
ncbi:MAG: hypothetical protein FJY55_14315 [Betaproteobacteria bacterium]|nr:hypothetical protein [Betaproteobacteria bacterium]